MTSQTAIGIDIGGTKVLAGLVDRDGTVGRTIRVPTPLEREEDVLGLFEELVADLRDDTTVAVGFSSLTLVSTATDALGFPGRVPLEGVRLRPWAVERFGLPVAVENDGNAATLAESRLGAGRGVDHLVMVVFGTGVGGGLILAGELYRGSSGVAAEFGQMTIDLEDGEPRSLEQLASGLALDASAADVGEPDGKRLIELAESGDEEARSCVAEFGRLMGLGVCTLVDLFNPQRVVLGGGVFDQGTQLLDAIRETVRERVLPPARDDVTVVRSELGSSAGMLGAAIAAFELREHG